MSNHENTNRVELSPSGVSFFAIPDSSLLESGLSSGVALPYSCANGSCGDCRARIVSGDVSKIRFHDFALTEAEKLDGVCLLCANAADSDLIIEVSEASSAQDIPLQELRGKVCHVEHVADVAIVRFKLARGKALRYLPGQYATITTAANTSMTLPIANCPCEPDYLEFHVPGSGARDVANQADAAVEPAVATCSLAELGHRDRVTIEGPHGVFTINEQLSANAETKVSAIHFIATATGFATIKPLLEHVMSQECETPCTLVWIASDSQSHYQHNLCRSWADAFDNISYQPLNSIEEFTVSVVRNSGMHRLGARIFISGTAALNSRASEVLSIAGVVDDSIQVDATI